MDQIQDVLELIQRKGLAKGRLRGVFHIAIGRTLSKPNGTVISHGITWRALATLLRDLRYSPDLVAELGVDPETLAPRDRNKFWYSAIGLANVGSPAAFAEAEKLATALKSSGIIVGPPPAPAREPSRTTILPMPLPS